MKLAEVTFVYMLQFACRAMHAMFYVVDFVPPVNPQTILQR